MPNKVVINLATGLEDSERVGQQHRGKQQWRQGEPPPTPMPSTRAQVLGPPEQGPGDRSRQQDPEIGADPGDARGLGTHDLAHEPAQAGGPCEATKATEEGEPEGAPDRWRERRPPTRWWSCGRPSVSMLLGAVE